MSGKTNQSPPTTDPRELDQLRAAYESGFLQCATHHRDLPAHSAGLFETCKAQARKAFPCPPKHREITVFGGVYRAVDGVLQTRNPASGVWVESFYEAAEIRALVKLLDSPFEDPTS